MKNKKLRIIGSLEFFIDSPFVYLPSLLDVDLGAWKRQK